MEKNAAVQVTSAEKGKVYFRHLRNFYEGGNVSNMGGATIAYQEVEPGIIKVSIAVCSKRDNFCRKKGRIIAGGRIKSPYLSVLLEVNWDEFVSALPYTKKQFDEMQEKGRQIEKEKRTMLENEYMDLIGSLLHT